MATVHSTDQELFLRIVLISDYKLIEILINMVHGKESCIVE